MTKALRNLIEIIHFTEKVSAKIYGLLDGTEIFRIVKEEFVKSKRYSASIVLLTDDKTELRIAETSLSPGKLKLGEKLTGLRLRGYKIDLNKSRIYRQVINEEKTVQVDIKDTIGELFPQPLARLVSKTMGYEKKKSILAPLNPHGKIVGVFAMTSTDLAEYFIPSVKNFAHHISTALELADEITERKKAEESLRKAHKGLEKRVEERTKSLWESEERFRALAQTANDAIITINSRGDIVFWNHVAETVFGYSADEVVGKPLTLIIPKRFRESQQNALQRVVVTGKSKFVGKTVEFFGLRKGGSEFPMELSLATWKTREGIFFTGIVRDITDRKRAEEALKKSRKQLKVYSESLEKAVKERTKKLNQLVESQKEFIAHIGHELRTPLSVIKAVVETELDSAAPTLVKKLSLIDKKVDQITKILKNLMWVSRLDTGLEKIHGAIFNLKGLLQEVLEDVVQETQKEEVNPQVRLICPQNLKLKADQTKIAEIVMNLLRNAIIHSNGQPKISLKVKKQKDSFQIIVEDNNPLIPKKELGKIFERFYQSKMAKEKASGLGLGLYICKRLVDLMAGKIWAETKRGIGNRLIVQLPVSF